MLEGIHVGEILLLASNVERKGSSTETDRAWTNDRSKNNGCLNRNKLNYILIKKTFRVSKNK